MNATRLVTLVAATIITAAESLLFLWALAPARVEATPVARTASGEVLSVIVVTARRDRSAHSTVHGKGGEPSRDAAADSASAGNHVHR